ncbi:electron transport complex protein RnfD [Vibrio variabilis]|uniref:Electron transport complex protein RnfD n=1 Tax=Vibrio variabilis TaxID=990271 RepID=A0ABQ0JAZ1_9VIBR|nr:electron transport complex protein RnfD [Vibrio variabilis]
MSFFIASSPHAHSRKRTPDLMKGVALCALPGLVAQTYFFGWGTLIQLAFAIVVGLGLEAAIMLLRKRSPC